MSETQIASAPARVRKRFRLLESKHYDLNPNFKGHTYHDPERLIEFKKGDIIESDRPLDKIYANKFEEAIPGFNAPIVVTEERRQVVTLLIQQGAWSEDDRTFLEELSDDGFQRIQKHTAPRATPEKRTQSALGEDVTDMFVRAYDEGYKVFRNAANKFQITKPGAPGKPINKEPLEQAEVDKFVDRHFKEK